MKTNLELNAIRVANIRRLIDEHESAYAFSVAADIHPSRTSHLLNPDTNAKSWRPVSEKTCRKIEERLGLPDGWMSTDHDAQEGTGGAQFGGMLGMAGRVIEELQASSRTQLAAIARQEQRSRAQEVFSAALLDVIAQESPAIGQRLADRLRAIAEAAASGSLPDQQTAELIEAQAELARLAPFPRAPADGIDPLADVLLRLVASRR